LSKLHPGGGHSFYYPDQEASLFSTPEESPILSGLFTIKQPWKDSPE
jgi:hypothetical protein